MISKNDILREIATRAHERFPDGLDDTMDVFKQIDQLEQLAAEIVNSQSDRHWILLAAHEGVYQTIQQALSGMLMLEDEESSNG